MWYIICNNNWYNVMYVYTIIHKCMWYVTNVIHILNGGEIHNSYVNVKYSESID